MDGAINFRGVIKIFPPYLIDLRKAIQELKDFLIQDMGDGFLSNKEFYYIGGFNERNR